MKKLIEDNELGLPISSPITRSIAHLLTKVIGIDRLNDFYGSLNTEAPVSDFVAEAIEKLGIEWSIDSNLTQKIPATGAAIVVSNFPHGAIDALLMLASLRDYRADTKILSESIFAKVVPLDQAIIEIEDLDRSPIGTLRGLRAARQHIESGGVLVIFPSQNVATYRKGFVDFGDDEWSLSIMKFIASTGAPVVPAYISGRNSLTYHLIRKFHHRIGTLRLIHEIFNKQSQPITVSFGEAISADTLSTLSPFDQWRRAIVAYIVLLQKLSSEAKKSESLAEPLDTQPAPAASTDDESTDIEHKKAKKERTTPLWPRALWPEKQNDIAREVQTLPHTSRLFSQGGYDLYLASTESLTEVTAYADSLKGRNTRSSAYRFSAEKDPHTHLLFCWDRENKRLASAVRLGYGNEIFDSVGVDGFYCFADFDFSHKFLDNLRSSIEVGDWVVADDYLALSEPRWLLWRGETSALMRSEKHNYLLSVVRICSSRSLTARRLIVNHLIAHYYKDDYRKQIVARRPIRSLGSPMFDLETMKILNRRDLMESFIRVADPQIDPLSLMLRRYIQVGGEAVALCLGRESDRDTVYALAMIDVARLRAGESQLFHVEQ